MVERIHSTIRKSLLCKYIENPSNFNIEKEIKKVMHIYNNIVHKSTNHTPNEVFYSQSQALYDEVKANCIKSFKYLENLEYDFSANDKCLLKNNFIVIKHKDKNGYYFLSKNKVKKDKSFYKLCCKIKVKYILFPIHKV